MRALLRLSTEHEIHILVPMVTFAEEMQKIREILENTANAQGCKQVPPIGAMIETPAAALSVGQIGETSDFLSIGTNDLTQYAMVAGRENPIVSTYFVDDDPAMLRLLGIAIKDAGDIPLSICGELAGRERAVPTLIQMGFRNLSVAAPLIPEIKEAVRQSHF
jgi:phosphoenolpyruvate-protein kinase (PTS system EI component)